MTDLLTLAVEQQIRATRRSLSMRTATTLSEALDAIEGTYYEIFLVSPDRARTIGYIDQKDGKITGLAMHRCDDDPSDDAWEVVDWQKETILNGATPVEYLATGEDTVNYRAEN